MSVLPPDRAMLLDIVAEVANWFEESGAPLTDDQRRVLNELLAERGAA